MVVGEKDEKKGTGQPIAPSPSAIDNILRGLNNTGTVKMNNHRKKLRQRFDIIKKLGQGTYGKVQLGINKETGQEVAIKTIKKCKIETEADLIRIRREVQIMSSVQHPNIIHIYEVFENREKMVLVMEFAAGGELYDYLSERKVLSEDDARRIFRQIATAVYYCHKHKICHRDLKLENILLDEAGNAKIADFGLSNVFDDKRLLATFCGSPLYASPEIVKGTPYQGPEVDCWSLGVLLYTLVYGAMPFDGSNFKRLVKQISAGDYYEPKTPSKASPLIREMLTVCPKQRATIEQICNNWWVNESYNESCLDVAEELAIQTPVRLDVLLSLAPTAITSDNHMIVPDLNEENKQAVARSMSVGSIQNISDIANTEAEKRIIDMVTAGGEAALAPSPTRNIVPNETSAVQAKRKPETTISTELVAGDVDVGARKREKPSEQLKTTPSKLSISEVMDVAEENEAEELNENSVEDFVSNMLPEVEAKGQEGKQRAAKKKGGKKDVDTIIEEVPSQATQNSAAQAIESKTVNRQGSLEESKQPATSERRRSRVAEAAEKLQTSSTPAGEKTKKVVIPGVNVGTHKKEFERKASLTSTPQPIVPPEKRHIINSDSIDEDATITGSRRVSAISGENDNGAMEKSEEENLTSAETSEEKLSQSDSKSSNLSLEEARRSMENSIAHLNKAKNESNSDVDQLCAKTENVAVTNDDSSERQKKLKNAREILGNAIPRLSGFTGRKPPVPFGLNGRSISGSVVPSPTAGPGNTRILTPPDPRMYERETPMSIYSKPAAISTSPNEEDQPVKVSHAEITLKSATLPRRKASHADNFKFGATKEPGDARSPPIQPQYYTPVYQQAKNQATSIEPQQQRPKEHYIPIQRPTGDYVASPGPVTRQRSMGPPLSRQSTNDSESSDSLTGTTQSTATLSTQPIKKSPREFIIPIAVEGVGLVTPRAGSLEPSDSNHSTNTSFSRFTGRPMKFRSIFNDKDSEDESSSPFSRMHRHTSLGRDSDTEDPASKFNFRLRTSRPVKKLQKSETNESVSSDDDDDGFEILTAENLFSTLLSRVRALTNRLNVMDEPGSNLASSRFMNNLGQDRNSFWRSDPFSRLKNSTNIDTRSFH